MDVLVTAQSAAQAQPEWDLRQRCPHAAWPAASLPLPSRSEILALKPLLAPRAPDATPFNCNRGLSSLEEEDCKGMDN